MKNFKLKNVMLSAAISALGMSVFASSAALADSAASFPERPVTIIVPYSAGGTTDTAARTMGEELSEKWGQPVVVENKPGAGNVVALLALKAAKPDGHTIIITPDASLTVNTLTRANLPYSPKEDFTPVMVLVRFPTMIAVTTQNEAQTFGEFVELAKTNPQTLATFGAGSSPSLAAAIFENATGVALQQIAYKGGGPVSAALQSGEVDSAAAWGALMPLIEADVVRPLMVGTSERSPYLPDVPTYEEAGYPDLKIPSTSFIVSAPAGTPADVVNKLNADLNEAIKTAEFEAFLNKVKYSAGGGTASEAAVEQQELTEFWRPIVDQLGLKLE